MDIVLVKSDQRGEAHEYYDILIRCSLPPALAEELMGKINKSLKVLEIMDRMRTNTNRIFNYQVLWVINDIMREAELK